MMEKLKRMSNLERLAFIEAAARFVHEDLAAQTASARAEQDRRMRAAALAVKDLYEPGGEIAEWSSLDAEEVLDDDVQHQTFICGEEA